MKKFIATTALGASTLRNQGKSIIKIARKFCENLNLSQYAKTNSKSFQNLLNKDTNQLLKNFGIKKKPWGTARKAINIFLRDALYNKYLSKHYKLSKIESFLELPLDSVVAKSLKEIDSSSPSWVSLKSLTQETSNQYQQIAKQISTKRNLSRIHLDITLWTENRQNLKQWTRKNHKKPDTTKF